MHVTGSSGHSKVQGHLRELLQKCPLGLIFFHSITAKAVRVVFAGPLCTLGSLGMGDSAYRCVWPLSTWCRVSWLCHGNNCVCDLAVVFGTMESSMLNVPSISTDQSCEKIHLGTIGQPSFALPEVSCLEILEPSPLRVTVGRGCRQRRSTFAERPVRGLLIYTFARSNGL